MSAQRNSVYYPAFDYLRILLATVVAAQHAGLVGWERAGSFSVQVFFALSGWLIGGILLAVIGATCRASISIAQRASGFHISQPSCC